MICKLTHFADFVPPNKSSACSSGGIKLVSGSRRITLDNTLDERLWLREDRVRHVDIDALMFLMSPVQMLPEIRYDLFGPTKIGNSIPSRR